MLNKIVEYAKNNPYVVVPAVVIALAAIATTSLYHPVRKEKLTQTEYTLKLSNDNVELTKKAGEELSRQVQLTKAKRAKEAELRKATEELDASVAKVAEIDSKIKENREEIYKIITTE